MKSSTRSNTTTRCTTARTCKTLSPRHTLFTQLEYAVKTLKKKQRELEEKSEANDKILQTNIETVRDEIIEQIKSLEEALGRLTEDIRKKPSIDEYRLKNGSLLQQEMDRLAFLVGETHGVILKIRGDQVQALASNTLCLSCGRGDVNFLPPVEVVKGTNGQYYRGTTRNNSFDYDVGR